jgi:hypothetical protein
MISFAHIIIWQIYMTEKTFSKKQISKRQDILRIQYMIQNKTQVETVNFRIPSFTCFVAC